jgi:hypothetical protein
MIPKPPSEAMDREGSQPGTRDTCSVEGKRMLC